MRAYPLLLSLILVAGCPGAGAPTTTGPTPPAAADAGPTGAPQARCGSFEMDCQAVVDRYLHDRTKASQALESLDAACREGKPQEVCWAWAWFVADGAKVLTDPPRARAWFTDACNAGHLPSCRGLGWMAEEGLGSPRDLLAGQTLYKKACEAGDLRACAALSDSYRYSTGLLRNPKLAAQYAKKGCDAGDVRSCANLGALYNQGFGVARDPVKGCQMLSDACDKGDMRGCRGIGFCLDSGDHGTLDSARAFALWQKACDGGDATSCANLGRAYERGRGVEQDYGKARQLYELACDGGSPWGCNNLGTVYDAGKGVTKDRVRAAGYYGMACERNHAFGCKNLAWLYLKGEGVGKDAEKGVRYMRLSCDLGEAVGCNDLAGLYLDGAVVEKDAARGERLLIDTCEQKQEADVCGYLAWRYENGKGVAADGAKALAYWQKACDGDSGNGCNGLGAAYAKGKLVAQDDAKAVQLYQKACDLEEMWGCSNRGWMYEKGRGGPQDERAAARYYQRACDKQHHVACNLLGHLYEDGRGVRPDAKKAMQLYTDACAAEEWGSCGDQARVLFLRGDATEGERLYTLACDKGQAWTCTNLSSQYWDGALSRNPAKTIEYGTRGCDGGSWPGCMNAGIAYADADHPQTDEARAVALYEKGCGGGHARSCERWANALRDGFGVPRDAEKAAAVFADMCKKWGYNCNVAKYTPPADPPVDLAKLEGKCAAETWVKVPGGAVALGKTARDPGVSVEVSPFSIGKTEVTQCQYAKCVKAKKCAPPAPDRRWKAMGANLPVTGVTREQAAAYCAWQKGALPTEAQWELAARGADGAIYPWGSDKPTCELARVGGCGDGPVDAGSIAKSASAWGIFDLVGNVVEWTADRYGPRPAAGSKDPTGGQPPRATWVVKGGSWKGSTEIGAGWRGRVGDVAAEDLGFRCVRAARK